jgi:rare lipoprotein A
VVVRVTDRGIPHGKSKLDLCRAAAEKLGMLEEGMAKVRIEILPGDRQLAAGSGDLQPTAPAQ